MLTSGYETRPIDRMHKQTKKVALKTNYKETLNESKLYYEFFQNAQVSENTNFADHKLYFSNVSNEQEIMCNSNISLLDLNDNTIINMLHDSGKKPTVSQFNNSSQ